jgi:ElaB/YqjD/DUF883 family membrane-anchored ribosome-binding protein
MTTTAWPVTKEQLVEEFNTVVAQTEQLLKTVADAGGERAGALRGSVEQSLAKAKERLRELQQSATDQTHAAMETADEYVHDNPWQAVGIAAGVGAVVGLVLGLSLNRR